MILPRRAILGGALAAPFGRARAEAAPVLRLGVLTDLSGPYRDVSGPYAVMATRMAADEAMAASPGLRVEVLQADHQNKPDIGAGIARQWFDQGGVDAIVDVPNSGVGRAVAEVAREKDRVFLIAGAATSDLTGVRCANTTVHWTYDTWMLARSTGGALVASGGKSWYFISADYVLGKTLQMQTAEIVERAGGRVLGASVYPFPQTTDFSSYLLQARASGAQVVAFANAGADTINCVKQAQEFGLAGDATKITALLMFVSDVHALGLPVAQGLTLTETFYWDLNDRTRAFTHRLTDRMNVDWRPNMEQAGSYAASLHYLRAAAAMGAGEAKRSGSATVARMKAMPTDDDAFGPGRIRADGRKLHPAHLFTVKSPAESAGPWDLYRLAGTTSADDAARPLDQGRCAMVPS